LGLPSGSSPAGTFGIRLWINGLQKPQKTLTDFLTQANFSSLARVSTENKNKRKNKRKDKTMGIFDRIGKAKPPSGSGNYFNPGDYLVTLIANRHFESRVGGHPTFVIESTIDRVLLKLDHVLDAEGKTVSKASNPEGVQASQVFQPTKHPYPDIPLGELRQYAAALLGVPFDEVTGEMVEKAFEDDGAAFAGLPLKVHVHDKPKKTGGGMVTIVRYSQPSAGELALLGASEGIPLE
jgi:hypothetical protein